MNAAPARGEPPGDPPRLALSEDEYFDIRDLSGIDQLSKLERVDVLSCCRVDDWSPLASCATLRSVAVPADTSSPVFDALRERGVQVEEQ